jgi:hypothetical protein
MKKERKIIKEYVLQNIKQEFLPVKLIYKINEVIFNNNIYEYRTKNNLLRCISTIYLKQVNDYSNLEYYIPTGSAYWKSIFGGDYYKKIIEPLINLDIIQTRDFGFRCFPSKDDDHHAKGKKVGSVGIRYRINTDLTDDQDFTTISYIIKNNSKVLSAEECVLNQGEEFQYEPLPDTDFFVSIDKQKAYLWLENNAEAICKDYLKTTYADELPTDLYIEYHRHLYGGSFNTSFASLKSAKFIAETHKQQLFFFKDKFYIADLEEFLSYRIRSLKYHYKREISKIGILPILNKRSPKTLRLHNHLVNFPSKILQFININNRTVVQLDLRTSQFLLFANLLNIYITKGEIELLGLFKKKQTKAYLKRLINVLKEFSALLPEVGVDLNNLNNSKHSSSDVIKFITDVFYQDFYSVVQNQLKLPERGLAKLMLFKLLFKKSNKPDQMIKKLAENYPVVMQVIASFKQKDQEKQSFDKSKKQDDVTSNFSVFLQCVEAEIFIDNILMPLRDKGIPCFTRHDSIAVANGYQDEVEAFAKAVFARLGFKYNHKVEDKFWEAIDDDELEDSHYLDWLADENELNTDFSIENQEEPLTVLTNTDDNMDETYDLEDQHLETIERLQKIGIQEDYDEFIDADFLEEIAELPFLSDEQRDILFDDTVNLRVGCNYLQSRTNELIRHVLDISDSYVITDNVE